MRHVPIRFAIVCVLCVSSGLDITDEQLEEMRSQVDNIDWDYAAKKEAEFRHDVMGHVHAFGHVCPKVGPVVFHTSPNQLTFLVALAHMMHIHPGTVQAFLCLLLWWTLGLFCGRLRLVSRRIQIPRSFPLEGHIHDMSMRFTHAPRL